MFHFFRVRLAKGFTLIELLVVIALLAILATLAAPSYRSFLVNQQLSSAGSDFLSSMLQARSEALRLGRPVVLAPIDGADWHKGWRIFVDQDGSGTYSSSQTLIFTRTEPLSDLVSINMETNKTTGPFSSTTPFFAYSPVGFSKAYPSLYSGGLTNGKLWLTASETYRDRVIIVSNSGRARLCDPTTDSGLCRGS